MTANPTLRTVGRLTVGTVLIAIAASCTFGEVPTPRPRITPSPTPTPYPTPTPAPPTATPSPTPDLGAIPDFSAGEIVTSRIDGLRVRQRPGLDATIATGLLPLGAELGVVMGPFTRDEVAWYLVTDQDPVEPEFEEGWVAAGYQPDAFLAETGRSIDASPFVIGMAGSGDAEEGPVEIGDGPHAIRWIAADPEAAGCRFAVSLAPVTSDPVPTIRATVGAGVDRGTLQPQTFASLGVRGTTFVSVVSDCAWSLVLLRAPDASGSPDPSASPSGG